MINSGSFDQLPWVDHHPSAGELRTISGLAGPLRACLMVVWMLALGCSDPAHESTRTAEAPAGSLVSGSAPPVFATAADQLDYAKSLSADPLEKKAALKVLLDRFPQAREQLGEARLELAYLQLGSDFRLAGEPACRRALAEYGAIAREFADLPAVRTKANWYVAWIHTDLLGDKPRGLVLYALLAEKYPQERFSRISPVPWLKLVFPERQPYTADDEHAHSWAGLALLEIVRHADEGALRMQAFDTLWRAHPQSLATGYALKAILDSPRAPPHMAQKAAVYMEKNTINPALNADLAASLMRLWNGQGPRQP